MNKLEEEINRLEDLFFSTLSRVVRGRRKGLGKTQEQVANDGGLSRSEVQFIEGDCRRAKLRTIFRLCLGLGRISMLELLAEEQRRERSDLGEP